MEPDKAQEISERDQLWASLRALRPEIDRLGMGEHTDTERERLMVMMIAQIVGAELDFRARNAAVD